MKSDTYLQSLAIACQMKAQADDNLLKGAKVRAIWINASRVLKAMLGKPPGPPADQDLAVVKELVALMSAPDPSIPEPLHAFCADAALTLSKHFRL